MSSLLAEPVEILFYFYLARCSFSQWRIQLGFRILILEVVILLLIHAFDTRNGRSQVSNSAFSSVVD